MKRTHRRSLDKPTALPIRSPKSTWSLHLNNVTTFPHYTSTSKSNRIRENVESTTSFSLSTISFLIFVIMMGTTVFGMLCFHDINRRREQRLYRLEMIRRQRVRSAVRAKLIEVKSADAADIDWDKMERDRIVHFGDVIEISPSNTSISTVVSTRENLPVGQYDLLNMKVAELLCYAQLKDKTAWARSPRTTPTVSVTPSPSPTEQIQKPKPILVGSKPPTLQVVDEMVGPGEQSGMSSYTSVNGSNQISLDDLVWTTDVSKIVPIHEVSSAGSDVDPSEDNGVDNSNVNQNHRYNGVNLVNKRSHDNHCRDVRMINQAHIKIHEICNCKLRPTIHHNNSYYNNINRQVNVTNAYQKRNVMNEHLFPHGDVINNHFLRELLHHKPSKLCAQCSTMKYFF